MNRIFRVEGGPLAEAIKAITAERERIGEQYITLNNIFGCEQIHTWPWTGRFAGCTFAPDKKPGLADWRLSHQIWVPRKKTVLGARYWKAIQELEPLPAIQTVLEPYGLTVHKPQLVCAPSDGPSYVEGFGHVGVYYVHVPWVEATETMLTLADVLGGTPDIDFVTKWKVPADWVEVTPYQKVLEWDILNRA